MVNNRRRPRVPHSPLGFFLSLLVQTSSQRCQGLVWLLNMKTLSQSLALVAALIAPTQAGLRFPCSTLTTQRLDPAAQPGSLPSAHLHMIVGGNAFNATM